MCTNAIQCMPRPGGKQKHRYGSITFFTTSRMENKNIDMDVKISVIFSHHQPDGKQKKDIQEFFRPPSPSLSLSLCLCVSLSLSLSPFHRRSLRNEHITQSYNLSQWFGNKGEEMNRLQTRNTTAITGTMMQTRTTTTTKTIMHAKTATEMTKTIMQARTTTLNDARTSIMLHL